MLCSMAQYDDDNILAEFGFFKINKAKLVLTTFLQTLTSILREVMQME